MRPRLTFKTVAVLGASALVLPFVGSAGFAAPSRVTVAGSVPSWATSAHAVGTPAASSQVSINVVLPLRGGAAVEQLAASLSNPNSKNYGQYQSAARFNAQFAPTGAQIAKVSGYLRDQGLHVTGTAAGNRWVSATGSVAQLNKAFGTTLRTYSYGGMTLRAPSKAVTVPSTISSLIQGVIGLNQAASLHRTDHSKPIADRVGPVANKTVKPSVKPSATPPPLAECSTYWNQHQQTVPKTYGKTKLPTTACGYVARDVRTAYGVQASVSHGLTGKGVTVAIIDAYASPTMFADANAWADALGEPRLKASQYTEAGTPDSSAFNLQDDCGGEVGWNEEESLDVEAVHGMAPGAKIHYVGGRNCAEGIDEAINYVVQTQSADIVSNSYGNLGEDGLGDEVALEHSFFLQAAVEGIGFYFSSGDDGDDTIDGLPHPEADYPASDSAVTAVGGTSLGVKQNGKRLFETSWGDTIDPVDFTTNPASLSLPLPGEFIFGGGGGTSSLFTQPYYQKNIVPDRFAKQDGYARMRVVPDVAAVGDPETGYVIGLSDGGDPFGLFVIGGTSLSCPLFAGMQALASQGRRVAIGFANPLMYNLGNVEFTDVRNPAKPIAFATETGSTVVVLGQDSSLVAIKGYDNTTGLGTPNGVLFLLGEAL